MIKSLLKAKYKFLSFQETVDQSEPFILLRHDIDISLSKALKMAQIDNALGVKSTFFFLVRTEHYNIFSKNGSDYVIEILELGHHIGLHFDCAAYPPSYDLNEYAQQSVRERKLMEDWFGREVGVISYHKPSPLVLHSNTAISAGVLHTYMPELTKDIRYISDSGGSWKYGHPLDSKTYHERKPIHILVHPIWWHDTDILPWKTLEQFIETRTSEMKTSLKSNCRVYTGVPNA